MPARAHREGARRRNVPSPSAQNGVTLLVDADSGRVRYQIEKHAAPKRRRQSPSHPAAIGAVTTRRPTLERRVRVFAFDPSLSGQLETATINEVTIRVPWERDQDGANSLDPGPVGEYLEVIDRDPASGCFYDPDRPERSASCWRRTGCPLGEQPAVPPADGLRRRDAHHPQLRAGPGRLALWRARALRGRGWQDDRRDEYVPTAAALPARAPRGERLLQPGQEGGAVRLLLGTGGRGIRPMPARITVFTCLSHDIIAHEVTHALLDGMHRRFSEPSNPDVLAFHEAFADIVALFQHFSLPEVLRHQIASHARRPGEPEPTRRAGAAVRPGDRQARRAAQRARRDRSDDQRRLAPRRSRNRATTRSSPSRTTAARSWSRRCSTRSCHLQSGGSQTCCASPAKGTGVLPAGRPASRTWWIAWPTKRPARPAWCSRCASARSTTARPSTSRSATTCARIVTADFEHDPLDDEHRRVAFVEAFRRRGIVPDGRAGVLGRRPAVAAGLGGARRRRRGRGWHRQAVGRRHPILGPHQGSPESCTT